MPIVFNDHAATPYWVAYYIDPLDPTSNNLDKYTSYVLEIEELVPTPFYNGAYVTIGPGETVNNILSTDQLI
jgi:hypothetical protein